MADQRPQRRVRRRENDNQEEHGVQQQPQAPHRAAGGAPPNRLVPSDAARLTWAELSAVDPQAPPTEPMLQPEIHRGVANPVGIHVIPPVFQGLENEEVVDEEDLLPIGLVREGDDATRAYAVIPSIPAKKLKHYG